MFFVRSRRAVRFSQPHTAALLPSRASWRLGALLLTGALVSGCQWSPSAEERRLDQVDLKIQQLEQRLNKLSVRSEDGTDKSGKPPAGVIKSLTLRLGSEDDRLRIYWADGTKTDIPCTKEQSTYVCG